MSLSRNLYAAGLDPEQTRRIDVPALDGSVGVADFNARLARLSADDVIALDISLTHQASVKKIKPVSSSISSKSSEGSASALVNEIASTASQLANRPSITSLHFKAVAQQSSINVGDLVDAIEAVEDAFGLSDDVPISVDVDPRFISVSDAAKLGHIGINRVRLNVGSFGTDANGEDRQCVSFRHVEYLASALRSCGVFDLDLRFNRSVFDQNKIEFLKTLSLALSLEADCISFACGENARPIVSRAEMDEALGVSDTHHLELANVVLKTTGYRCVGYDHFFRPGSGLLRSIHKARLVRNVVGFNAEQGDIVLGFGPAAMSQFPDLFVQNEPHINRYEKQCLRDKSPKKDGVILSRENQVRAKIIEDLVCLLSADVEGYCRIYDVDLSALNESLEALDPLIENGAVSFLNGRLQVNEKSRALTPLVASCFGTKDGAAVS